MTDPQHPKTWRLLIVEDQTAEVMRAFEDPHPDVSILKGWYEGCFLQQEPGADLKTDIGRRRFAGWFNWQMESAGDLRHRHRPRLEWLLYGSYSNKVSLISQRHCGICAAGRPVDDLFPVYVLPIRITPKSRQAIETDFWAAFQAAVRHWLDGRRIDLGPTGRLCVAITFVLSPSKTDRDLDNMVKALQDALARALAFNDKHVHHLDAVKLIFPTEEEYVYVRLAPSALNEHADVLAPIVHQTWATKDQLVLEDFLPSR